MQKPKMYRSPKSPRETDLTKFKKNAGGGTVKGIIVGPESSIGDQASHPGVSQGNETGGNTGGE